MKYRITVTVFIACSLLAALSFATKPLRISAAGDTLNISVKSALGEGVLWAVLGGYRSLAADLAWIKAYNAWEASDVSRCTANIELAARLDPKNLLYWHMGSGIIAYDIPHWIIDDHPHTPLQTRKVKEHQGRQALEFLDRGLQWFPDNRRLYLNKALVYEKVFGDTEKMLEAFGEAAKGDAPLFIIRDYAGKLEGAEKIEEALSELKRAEAMTDKNHPAYKFLIDNIKQVENKLNLQKKMLDSEVK